MSEEVAWSVELKVRSGQIEQFRALTATMVAAVRGEQGVLNYRRFATEDDQCVHVYERYENSQAAARHLRVFIDRFGTTFSRLAERTKFTVYGDPSDELRGLLNQFAPIFMKPFGGLGIGEANHVEQTDQD